MRLAAIILAGLVLAFPPLALAQGPEQIDQLEPGDGEWQGEYYGTFGPGGEREHVLEAMFGLTERLAIGVELEAEYLGGNLTFDTIGPKALYRLTDAGSPVALGIQAQVSLDREGSLAEAELRLIAERQRDGWWAQSNIMLRRSVEDAAGATSTAYAWSLQRSLADRVWLGLESSGQVTLQSTNGQGADEQGHFAGPSLTLEWEPGPDREIEIGLAYFRRLEGSGPKSSGRLFVQMSF